MVGEPRIWQFRAKGGTGMNKITKKLEVRFSETAKFDIVPRETEVAPEGYGRRILS